MERDSNLPILAYIVLILYILGVLGVTILFMFDIHNSRVENDAIEDIAKVVTNTAEIEYIKMDISGINFTNLDGVLRKNRNSGSGRNTSFAIELSIPNEATEVDGYCEEIAEKLKSLGYYGIYTFYVQDEYGNKKIYEKYTSVNNEKTVDLVGEVAAEKYRKKDNNKTESNGHTTIVPMFVPIS